MVGVKRGSRLENTAWNIILVLVVGGFSIAILYPFWIMIVDSFSTSEFADKIGLKLWPDKFILNNYKEALSADILGRAYFNTIAKTVFGTFLTVSMTLGLAYGLSKAKLPFGKTLSILVVITMFFNGGIIPTFLLMRGIGLINNPIGLVFPFLINAYAVFIMRSFLRNIPDSIEESAIIDGANELQILVYLILPLSKPIVATVALWTCVLHWNEWFYAMIYCPAPDFTVLQLLLRRILVENQFASTFEIADTITANAERFSQDSITAATLFVSIGPIILAYPFFQRFFITGAASGSIKG
ncbi:MAG: carbohydrate ABC transporter permease [Bacteroidetes bacterium]|nr:carbohydrate ABC transporter permease [Bacteroidota bacterium]